MNNHFDIVFEQPISRLDVLAALSEKYPDRNMVVRVIGDAEFCRTCFLVQGGIRQFCGTHGHMEPII